MLPEFCYGNKDWLGVRGDVEGWTTVFSRKDNRLRGRPNIEGAAPPRQIGKSWEDTRYIHSRVKADGFVDHGAQIFHFLHIVEGRSSSLANCLEDLLSEAFQNVRILGEHIDGKCDAVCRLEILNGVQSRKWLQKAKDKRTVSRPARRILRISSRRTVSSRVHVSKTRLLEYTQWGRTHWGTWLISSLIKCRMDAE